MCPQAFCQCFKPGSEYVCSLECRRHVSSPPPPPAPSGTWTGLKCASFRTKTVPKSLKAFVRVAGAAPLCQPHLDGRPGFAEQRAAGQQGRAKHVRRRKGGLLFNGEGWLLNALHARVFVLSKSCHISTELSFEKLRGMGICWACPRRVVRAS